MDNATVLCLRCHAEAGHFNPKHPLGTKYSPTELIRHRDAWFEACEQGTAKYSSHIDVQIKRKYLSSDLHKYILFFNFHNGNKKVISGWKLEIFIPHQIGVSTVGVKEISKEIIDDMLYRKFQIERTDPIYLGESCELTDMQWCKIEYDINSDIYYSARTKEIKVIWSFYSREEPPIKGYIPWEELQQF